MDWFDLPDHGTLKSLLQNHSSKTSILWCSAFFIVQLSHPYMTTGKTIALTRRTFVGKVMSLLFNMLPRFLIPPKSCLQPLMGKWVDKSPTPTPSPLECVLHTGCQHSGAGQARSPTVGAGLTRHPLLAATPSWSPRFSYQGLPNELPALESLF